jgi:hypothetical protein
MIPGGGKAVAEEMALAKCSQRLAVIHHVHYLSTVAQHDGWPHSDAHGEASICKHEVGVGGWGESTRGLQHAMLV